MSAQYGDTVKFESVFDFDAYREFSGTGVVVSPNRYARGSTVFDVYVERLRRCLTLEIYDVHFVTHRPAWSEA